MSICMQHLATDFCVIVVHKTGFVQTLEGPGINLLRFPGLESPGKKPRSWKTLEKSWNSNAVILEFVISAESMAQ